LVILGSNSVPYLIPIMNGYPADSSKVAVQTLGSIGESALPPLLRVATNRTKLIQLRRLVLEELFFANPTRRLPVVSQNILGIRQQRFEFMPEDRNYLSSLTPILIPCLHERGLEDSTIRVLGRLGFTVDTAFQVFTNAITAKNVDVRIAAVRWAALFKSNAPRATPELIKCFNDPDLAVRKEATNALQKIAPEVAPSASH